LKGDPQQLLGFPQFLHHVWLYHVPQESGTPTIEVELDLLKKNGIQTALLGVQDDLQAHKVGSQKEQEDLELVQAE
jgi:hypothetical protein